MAKKTAAAPAKKKAAPAAAKKPPAPVAAAVFQPLPSIWQLMKTTVLTLWGHKKLFAGVVAWYGLCNLILVQSLASGDSILLLKHNLQAVLQGQASQVGSSLSSFTQLVGSAGNGSSPTAGAYQVFLTIVVSLAVIWLLRQLHAGRQPRIRDAYYRGAFPLVPFILVLLLIGVQLLPLLLASTVYSIVVTNNIAVNGVEQVAWGLLVLGAALLSFYWVASSTMALYIVTLADMTPMNALRTAKALVRGRRWGIVLRMLVLPLVLIIGAGVIMLPIVLLLTPLATWVFFALSLFGLPVVHTYFYTLYRSLLPHDR